MSAAQDGQTGRGAGLPQPIENKQSINVAAICEKIRKELSLTPPGVIDALCEGVPTRLICVEATFVKEALEVARMLGRAHLLNFDADC
jgi:hypothetical protein